MAELQNARHEKFAQGIASGLSQRKAYRAAFPNSMKWKDETVDVKASELKKNDKVLVRLEELAQKASSDAIMDATERKEWLTKIVKSAMEETKDKLKAVDLLNKMDGTYITKVEVDANVNMTDRLKEVEGYVKGKWSDE
jgi:hypothetical protein